MTCTSYWKFNFILFHREIDATNCDNILQIDDVLLTGSNFRNDPIRIIETHIPTTTLKIRIHVPDCTKSDYLAHNNEKQCWFKRVDKYTCQYQLTKKLDSIDRSSKLRDALKRNIFKTDSMNIWKLISYGLANLNEHN